MEPRYFLSQDQSGHWYLVDNAIREEWDRWNALDEDDEAAWAPPIGARSLGTGPQMVTFTNPHMDYRRLP